jgi:3-deoxy-manno-octulosonate cytidylyltransferase (CMP-KDO synthetase)
MTAASPGVLGVIPVRMTATRLPGKPLMDLGGRSVVQRVHDAALASGVFSRVVVATDDDDIAAEVRGFGGEVQMTSSAHTTGTERVAEVASTSDAPLVANVQGDQPFVTTQMLRELVAPLLVEEPPAMTTIGCPLHSVDQLGDPSVVKVVRSLSGSALYFTRSPVPFGGSIDARLVLHHIGLYAFRADFLRTYASLAPTPLEQAESLEQLRVLEHGEQIALGLVDAPAIEINTPADYDAACRLVAAGGAPWQQ